MKEKEAADVKTFLTYLIYYRSERVSLQDRSESAKMKANHLVAEILQVKQQLEEVEARIVAGTCGKH